MVLCTFSNKMGLSNERFLQGYGLTETSGMAHLADHYDCSTGKEV